MICQTRRILLLDDRPDVRALVGRMLVCESDVLYELLEAGTGAAGANLRSGVDCAILVDDPPEIDAAGPLAAMRQNGEMTCCPVIVLTGAHSREHAAGWLRAGAMDSLVQSQMNPESLTRALENAKVRFALFRERHQAEQTLRTRLEKIGDGFRAVDAHATGDLVDRKDVEKQLRESEERYRILFEQSVDGIYIATREGRFVDASPTGCQMLGMTRQEVLCSTFTDVLVPDEHPRISATVAALADGKVHFSEWVFRRKDGTRFIGELAGRDLPDGRLQGIVRDITERKRAEDAIRASETRLRMAMEAGGIFIWDCELTDRTIRWSDNTAAVLGCRPEELPRLLDHAHFFIAPEDTPRVLSEYAEAVKRRDETYRTEYRGRGELSSARHYSAQARILYDPQGVPVRMVGVTQDITQRERAEQELRSGEERFRTLADNISQLAWMADAQGLVFWYNLRWYDYTGTTLEEMEGWGWKKVHHPDHVDRVVERLQQSWDTGEPWEDTFPLRGKDGSYRWFLSRALPIRDEKGRVVRWFGTNTDVTEQRALEQALEDRDRRKDEFLAMLAHELRNPLAPIRNAVQILRLTRPGDPAVKGPREIIERQVNQLVRPVDDLLDVSRVSRGKIPLAKAPLNLVAVVRQAVETSLPHVSARRHELNMSLPTEAIRVNGDFTRLIQVVGNLLNNAAKFTDEGGQIHLTVENRNAPGADTGEAVIRVRDNGRGIDPMVLEKLFDLFYQVEHNLARADGGLGIGLSLVKSLVEMHGGRVEARSAGRGKGSEFVVHLPLLSEAPPAARAKVRLAETDQAHPCRILVVDDNRDSAESMTRLLDLDGHTVLAAHDGQTAVEIALRERPDVVLLDIGLPRLDGYQACQRMREGGLTEALIVAMSGYGQEQDRRRSAQAAFDWHLVKPVDYLAVQELLAERKPAPHPAAGDPLSAAKKHHPAAGEAS